VQVTFWLQGSATDTEAATPDPERENTFFFDLPRSDRLKICEYMFYQWTVVYDNSVTSTRGTHVGATSYVMPTSTINADGSISQALCVGPEE
jgi:hypothetical protein